MKLRWKDGKLYDVREDRLDDAVKAGFTAPTDEQYAQDAAQAQTGEAFVEGVGRGLTLGATDYFAKTYGDKVALQEREARRTENPWAAGAGEVLGSLPMMAVPVAGPVGSLAARAGTFAASEGIKGGLLGMGSAISEASLQDHDLTAERLAMGAVAGGVTNVLAGAAIKGVGVAADKLLQKGAEFMPATLKWAGDKARAQAIEPSKYIGDEALTFIGKPVSEAPSLDWRDLALAGGAMWHGGPLAGAAFVATRGGLKMFGPKAGDIVGNAVRKVGQSPIWEAAAEAFKNQVLERAAVGFLSPPVRAALIDAAGRGTEAFLAEHSRQAQADPNYLPTLALQSEDTAAVKSAGARLAALHGAVQVSNELAAQQNDAIEGFFRSNSASIPSRKRSFEDIKAGLNGDPSKFFEQVVSPSMPNISSMQAATLAKTSMFLQGQIPKDPNELAPPALKRPWKPSAADIAKFNRFLDAIEMPNQIMKSGNILPEHVQAWQAVYPRWFADTQTKMLQALAMWEKKGPVPYSKRNALAIFLGPQAHGMSPQQIMTVQAVHKDVAPPANPKGPDGRQEVDQEDNMETQGQRMEAR